MAVMYWNDFYPRIALIFIFLVSVQINRAPAQDNSAAKSFAFEVASVKPVDSKIDPNVPRMMGVRVYPGGRVMISSFPLKVLIATAFRLSYWQISGGDAWVEKDMFHVEAKPSEKLQSSIKTLRHTVFGIEDEHLREMLQALLIDRFQLRFHRETKTGTVYLLQRNGKPLGLRPTESLATGADTVTADPKSFGSIGYVNGRWGLSATTMPQLVQFAAAYILQAPVLDQTELSGQFDYKQRSPDLEPIYGDNSESFLRWISETGLKLVRSKGNIETFVIDHAAKPLPD